MGGSVHSAGLMTISLLSVATPRAELGIAASRCQRASSWRSAARADLRLVVGVERFFTVHEKERVDGRVTERQAQPSAADVEEHGRSPHRSVTGCIAQLQDHAPGQQKCSDRPVKQDLACTCCSKK